MHACMHARSCLQAFIMHEWINLTFGICIYGPKVRHENKVSPTLAHTRTPSNLKFLDSINVSVSVCMKTALVCMWCDVNTTPILSQNSKWTLLWWGAKNGPLQNVFKIQYTIWENMQNWCYWIRNMYVLMLVVE